MARLRPSKTVLVILIVIILLILSFFAAYVLINYSPAPHPPIWIEGNEEFTLSNGVRSGSGSQSDPYVIEGWDINANNYTYGIGIRATTAFFIIRNCNIYDANLSSQYFDINHFGYGSGIFLSNVSNGMVEHNIVTGNYYGIRFNGYSNDSEVADNSLIDNSHSGVLLGIKSNRNTIIRNQVSGSNNGIELFSADWNIIRDNHLTNNRQLGIRIGFSSNNMIWNNTFTGNNGAGGSFNASKVQARDDEGTNNHWNSSGTPHGYGNYWSDWTSPDNNNDSIVDSPYGVAGSAGANDYYPLAVAGISADSSMIIIAVIAIAAVLAALVAILLIRKKP